jgi:hypothetical protein
MKVADCCLVFVAPVEHILMPACTAMTCPGKFNRSILPVLAAYVIFLFKLFDLVGG